MKRKLLYASALGILLGGFLSEMKANGHFLAGAYSGYTGNFALPLICYTYTNLYARIRHGEVYHTQDNLMSFGKGALLGSGVCLLKKITTAISYQCTTESEKRLQFSLKAAILKTILRFFERRQNDQQKDETDELSATSEIAKETETVATPGDNNEAEKATT